MTVKSERGRRRYIAFTADPEMTKESAVRIIPGGKRFNIIQCAEGMAIVRCAPEEIDECISAFRQVDPTCEALTVSGTLRTLRDRYPILKKTAPPKPRKSPAPKK